MRPPFPLAWHLFAWVVAGLLSAGCKKSAPTELRPKPTKHVASKPITPRKLAVGDVSASVFRFVLARTRVEVVDLGMSNELGLARRTSGADLAINGAFFDPTSRPEGLVISEGKELSPLVPTLSGGVLVIDGRKGTLFESESYVPALMPPSFAMQCRPRLVVDTKRNIQSDDGKRAARTALCLRDGGLVLDAVIARVRGVTGADGDDGPTLFALAEALSRDGCEQALNLDGGPSTGLSYRAADGDHDEPPARKVRHAVVFLGR
jgi:exopolysaccharide biosynthesis protein